LVNYALFPQSVKGNALVGSCGRPELNLNG